MPKIIDQAADELLKHLAKKNENSNNLVLWDLGIRLVLMYMLFAILKGVFLFFTRQTIIVMSRNIEFDLKNEIFSKYQQLTISFYKNNKTGDLMNRISEDVTKVRMYLGPAIMYSINVVVLFVMVITFMFYKNATLTMYVLFPLPVLSVIIYFVSSIINKKSEIVYFVYIELFSHLLFLGEIILIFLLSFFVNSLLTVITDTLLFSFFAR